MGPVSSGRDSLGASCTPTARAAGVRSSPATTLGPSRASWPQRSGLGGRRPKCRQGMRIAEVRCPALDQLNGGVVETQQLKELLLQSLVHERGGVKVYEAALQCAV